MKRLLFVLLLLLLTLTAVRAQDVAAGTITLEHCIALALRNNISLGLQVAEVERRQGVLNAAGERYFPVLAGEWGRGQSNSPTSSWIEAENQVSASFRTLTARLTQALPLGGTFTLAADTSRYESDARFQTINPRFESGISFALTQPLLRGMGGRISRKEIVLARLDRSAAGNALQAALIDTVFRVEELYWNLAFAARNLEAKERSLRLAEDLQARNRKMVAEGLLAEIEILNAEAEVAGRQADVLVARAQGENAADELRSFIDPLGRADELAGALRPGDEPVSDERPVDAGACLRQARENRPDLRNAGLDLQSRTFELGVARNQALPGLNLNARYWSPGLSGNRLIYRDDDPLSGDVIGVIPGAAADAMRNALRFQYRNWSLYLSLEVPVGPVLFRGALRAARAARHEAVLRGRELERQVALDTNTAVRGVQSGFRGFQAFRLARELAARKLAAEEKRLAVGLSTSYTVLQYQRDFSQALSNELRALCDYNLALARLQKVCGTTLQERHISWAAPAGN